tara:strand:- start:9331 stop:9462 length:132 start_codon:yes stop_codon:yes gene_type:complete
MVFKTAVILLFDPTISALKNSGFSDCGFIAVNIFLSNEIKVFQ